MNWLDIVILVTLGWFAFAGLSAGILRESVTFLGAVLGVVLAGVLYQQLAEDLSVFGAEGTTARIIAFIAIFGAVFLAGQIGAVLLKGAATALMLGSVDHTAGLVFGILKGFVIVEGALILFTRYHITAVSGAIDGSFLSPVFLDGLPVLLNVLPSEFRTAVESFHA